MLRRMTHWWFIGIWVVVLLAGCASDAATPVASTPASDLPISSDNARLVDQVPTPVPDAIISAADAEYLLLTNLYERTSSSIVNIEAVFGAGGSGFLDVSRGSGFVYDLDGHIITNAHVVKDSSEIRVTFEAGYVADADLIGIDTFSDLAVIKVDVDAEWLNPLPIGDSDTVRVGQRAIAIGNPFGLSSSMSTGIISGVGRTLRSAELIDINAVPGFQNPSIIQTDTPINPGNSGGPLMNSNGEVIGVNTAIRTESGIFQGVGFAVPANTVRRVIPELIENGRVEYAWIGISVMPEEDGFGVAGLSEPLGLPVTSGVLIRGVQVGSPADNAGIQPGDNIRVIRDRPVCIGGDIIVAIDDHYVANMDELVAYLVMNNKPGDTVTMLVVRDDQTIEVPVTLQARPTDSNPQVRGCEF